MRETVEKHQAIVSYISEVPVPWMPDDLAPPANAISLIADPNDHRGKSMVAYLVNDRDEPTAPVPCVFVFQEIKIGRNWVRSEPFTPVCGSGGKDYVRPRHARILHVPRADLGDMEAEIRYCLFTGTQMLLVTRTIKGKVRSADLNKAGEDLATREGIAEEIEGLYPGIPREAGIVTSAFELAAAMQLERAYDESRRSRASLRHRIEQNAFADGKELALLKGVLSQPWEEVMNERNCLALCIDALSKSATGPCQPGTPAAHPAMVWSYLAEEPKRRREFLVNPERFAVRQALDASGNPWGATAEECKTLRDLAQVSINRGDTREKKAAAEALLIFQPR